MKGFDCALHGRQHVEGLTCQDILIGETGCEETPGLGLAHTVSRPTYSDPVIRPVQKDLDIRTAHGSRFFESALAPALEPNQCCLDMLAGAQAVDAVIRAVAAVDGFYKGSNLYPISLSALGIDPIDAKKIIARCQRFNLENLGSAAQAAAFDLIHVTGRPTC